MWCWPVPTGAVVDVKSVRLLVSAMLAVVHSVRKVRSGEDDAAHFDICSVAAAQAFGMHSPRAGGCSGTDRHISHSEFTPAKLVWRRTPVDRGTENYPPFAPICDEWLKEKEIVSPHVYVFKTLRMKQGIQKYIVNRRKICPPPPVGSRGPSRGGWGPDLN